MSKLIVQQGISNDVLGIGNVVEEGSCEMLAKNVGILNLTKL